MKIKTTSSLTSYHTPVIPALGRQRWEDDEFKLSLSHKVKPVGTYTSGCFKIRKGEKIKINLKFYLIPF